MQRIARKRISESPIHRIILLNLENAMTKSLGSIKRLKQSYFFRSIRYAQNHQVQDGKAAKHAYRANMIGWIYK